MTIQISDAQRTILTTACERKGGLVLPVTRNLKGGAIKTVIASLLTKGLIEEVSAKVKQEVWRTSDDSVRLTIKATKAAYETLGLKRRGRTATAKPQARERGHTKQAQLVAMLRRPEGATIAQIVKATGWLPHTVRGAIAGALKKRLGLDVTSDTEEGRGRVYRIQA